MAKKKTKTKQDWHDAIMELVDEAYADQSGMTKEECTELMDELIGELTIKLEALESDRDDYDDDSDDEIDLDDFDDDDDE